jgi:hypothetical protein
VRTITRVRKIRELQREVATSTKRKQVRKDALAKLIWLTAEQIAYENRQDKKRTA